MHKGREASFAFCLMILRLKIPNTLSGPRWIQVGYKNSRFSTNISLHHGNGIEDKHELLIGRLISMILNELKRPYPDIYFPDKREIWHGSLLPPVPNFAAPCQISRLSGQKCENSAQNWQNIEFWPYICPSRATRLHNFLRNSQPLYASLGRF